jgi:hypothetical protein
MLPRLRTSRPRDSSSGSLGIYVAGLLEITQGDAISSPGFPLPGELHFLEEIVDRGTNSEAGVVFDGVRNDQACSGGIEFSLLSNSAVVCRSCVGADGNASAFSLFVPVEVVGAFRVPLLPVIDHHPIALDAAVGADDNGAVTLAFGGVDTLGDIHLHGKSPGKVVSLLVSPSRSSVKLDEKEEVRWSGRRDSNPRPSAPKADQITC